MFLTPKAFSTIQISPVKRSRANKVRLSFITYDTAFIPTRVVFLDIFSLQRDRNQTVYIYGHLKNSIIMYKKPL